MAAPQANDFRIKLLILATLAVCGSILATCPADPDLWGHVQYGRDVLRDWSIPATTTYSYTAEGYRWINHENLAEIFLAIGADTVGPIGMKIAKTLLALLAIATMMFIGRRQEVGWPTLAFCSVLVALNISHFWILRPQLMTLLCLVLMLLVFEKAFAGWQDHFHLTNKSVQTIRVQQLRWLWLAVLVLWVWTNSHGGFLAGVAIFGATLVFRSIEFAANRNTRRPGLFLWILLIGFAGILVTFINPYGPGLHRWLLSSLGVPRPEISEWVPTNLLTAEAIPKVVLFATCGISLVVSKKPRDFTKSLVLLLVLWQTLEHMRHLAIFAILFGFWMPVHVQSTINRCLDSKWLKQVRTAKFWKQPVTKMSMSVGLMLIIVVFSHRMFVRWSDLRVHRSQYPISALQYIVDQDLQGDIVVTFDWAQYVIGALGHDDPEKARMRVAFDGRFRTCYPQELVDMHFDLILGMDHPEWRWRSPQSPPFEPTRILDFKNPNFVLISREEPHSVRVMQNQQKDWELIYQDSLAQLWARKVDLVARTSPVEKDVSDRQQVGTVTWPAFPQPKQTRNVSHSVRRYKRYFKSIEKLTLELFSFFGAIDWFRFWPDKGFTIAAVYCYWKLIVA